jgi:hypothetical protein
MGRRTAPEFLVHGVNSVSVPQQGAFLGGGKSERPIQEKTVGQQGEIFPRARCSIRALAEQ